MIHQFENTKVVKLFSQPASCYPFTPLKTCFAKNASRLIICSIFPLNLLSMQYDQKNSTTQRALHHDIVRDLLTIQYVKFDWKTAPYS